MVREAPSVTDGVDLKVSLELAVTETALFRGSDLIGERGLPDAGRVCEDRVSFWTIRRPETFGAAERKSSAGCKPYDALLKFKILVLQSLYNLLVEQTEYLIRDRLAFMRFLDLGLEDPVPDATTIWLFREALVEVDLIDKLFERFSRHLQMKGYFARGSCNPSSKAIRQPLPRTKSRW